MYRIPIEATANATTVPQTESGSKKEPSQDPRAPSKVVAHAVQWIDGTAAGSRGRSRELHPTIPRRARKRARRELTRRHAQALARAQVIRIHAIYVDRIRIGLGLHGLGQGYERQHHEERHEEHDRADAQQDDFASRLRRRSSQATVSPQSVSARVLVRTASRDHNLSCWRRGSRCPTITAWRTSCAASCGGSPRTASRWTLRRSIR